MPDVIDALAVTLTGHPRARGADSLPLIGMALRDQAAATLGSLPPPLRLLYRALWKPRYEKTPRW